MTIGGVKSALDGDGKTTSRRLGSRLLLMLPKPYRFIEECGLIIQTKKGSRIPAEASSVYPFLAETINRGYGLGVALLFAF